jgi:hypothetical protein
MLASARHSGSRGCAATFDPPDLLGLIHSASLLYALKLMH